MVKQRGSAGFCWACWGPWQRKRRLTGRPLCLKLFMLTTLPDQRQLAISPISSCLADHPPNSCLTRVSATNMKGMRTMWETGKKEWERCIPSPVTQQPGRLLKKRCTVTRKHTVLSCNLEKESWSENCLSAKDLENSDPTGRTRCILSSRERLLIALSMRSQVKMGKAARECSVTLFYPVTTYLRRNQSSLQSLMYVLKSPWMNRHQPQKLIYSTLGVPSYGDINRVDINIMPHLFSPKAPLTPWRPW